MKIQAVKLVEEMLDDGSLVKEWKEQRHNGLRFEGGLHEVHREGDAFDTCVFSHVKVTGKMNNASMIDVIFRNCDLSLLDMEESFFCRVRFEHCRMKGFQAINATFRDTVFTGCACQYCNLNESRMKNVLLEESMFQEAGLAMMESKGMKVSHCDFTGTEFTGTSLSGMDFADSILVGIQASQEDFKGMTVNASQAISLLEILGIHVK